MREDEEIEARVIEFAKLYDEIKEILYGQLPKIDLSDNRRGYTIFTSTSRFSENETLEDAVTDLDISIAREFNDSEVSFLVIPMTYRKDYPGRVIYKR